MSTHSLEHPISINNIKYCYGVIISSGATSVVISAGNPPPDSQALRWLWRQGTHEAARQAHEMDQVIKGASPTTPVTALSPFWAGGHQGVLLRQPGYRNISTTDFRPTPGYFIKNIGVTHSLHVAAILYSATVGNVPIPQFLVKFSTVGFELYTFITAENSPKP